MAVLAAVMIPVLPFTSYHRRPVGLDCTARPDSHLGHPSHPGVDPPMKLFSSLLALSMCGTVVVFAAAPPAVSPPLPKEFQDYRTVETAIRAKQGNITAPATPAQPGYLGVTTEEKDGKFIVAAIQ